MKWLIPENDLEREQRAFLESITTSRSNHLLNGFPGSGKSICLLYAVLWIKRKYPNAKILFVEFNHTLRKMIKAALAELQYQNTEVVTMYEFINHYCQCSYDYIICDEVQDIPAKVISVMNRTAKIVIVGGDRNQSIYTEDPKWSFPPATPAELIAALSPVQTTLTNIGLTIIHRLGKYVVEAINRVVPGLNIMAEKISMIMKHIKPNVWECLNTEDEVEKILAEARAAVNIGESVGILFPSHYNMHIFFNIMLRQNGTPAFQIESRDYYNANKYLTQNNIPVEIVLNGQGDINSRKIQFMTYHGSKGVDFDKVYMPFCEMYQHPKAGDVHNPTLFMVAMTRSRKDLTLSFSYNMHEFLEKFATDGSISVYTNFKEPEQPNSDKEKSEDQKNDNQFEIDW